MPNFRFRENTIRDSLLELTDNKLFRENPKYFCVCLTAKNKSLSFFFFFFSYTHAAALSLGASHLLRQPCFPSFSLAYGHFAHNSLSIVAPFNSQMLTKICIA